MNGDTLRDYQIALFLHAQHMDGMIWKYETFQIVIKNLFGEML
jgi:hypothetical protein